MNVLITGGAGFIGSHLVDFYLNGGHKVTAIDNLMTGKIDNVRHQFDNTNFKLIIDTVLNKAIMEELIRDADRVLHMAAPVGVKFIMDHPVHTLLDNVRGTDVVLELCNKYRKKVLVASTSEVYGRNLEFGVNQGEERLHEESLRVMGSTKNHRWAYANTKAFDEFLSFAYRKEYGLPVVVVRFFNTVGPRQTGQYGMVIPNFVKSALNNERIHIYGTGDQSRCFAHITDVVWATTKLLETEAAYGDVFNIGGEEEVTMLELAKMIVKMTQSTSEIKYLDYQSAYGDGFEDMMKRTPDLGRISKLIGYVPKNTLEDILQDIIAYHKSKM
jgi:UDP-glucose 4-epimerase